MPAEDDPARRTLRQRLTSAAVWSATAAMLVVTVVLHALASVTPSPGGSNMQDEVGEQCQRPRLFIGLLAMSSVRHGLALVCSTWVFLRRRRVRKAHDRALRDLVTAIETGRTNVGNANADANANRSGGANADRISYAAASSTHSLPVPITNSPLPRPPPASTSSYYAHSNSTGVYGQRSSMYQRSNTSVVTFATAPSPPPNHNLYKVAKGADTFGSLPPNATIIQPPQAASMPSLILPAHNSTMIYNHAAAASTTSLASQRFSAGSGSVSPAAHLYTFPPPEDTNASASSPRASLIAPTPMASLPSLHPAAAASTHSLAPTGGSSIPMTPARQSIHSLTHHASASASGMTYPPTPLSARGVPGTPRPASQAAGSRPVSQATRYPEPYVPKSERRKQRNHKWAKLADALATSVLGFLSFWTFALWAIGSGVCIAELPTVTSHSCYNGSPLLWWGVMSSALVFGWLHALYYAWFIIGGFFLILGSSIYILIAYVMGWPIHPAMHRPRTPRPEKLSHDELAACPIVAYLPDPSEPLPEPSIYDGASKAESVHEGEASGSKARASALLKKSKQAIGLEAEKSTPSTPTDPNSKGVPVPPGEADTSRLGGLPGVVLSAHQATCAICQSSFVPPREVPGRLMYEVEQLRQLPCKHVFHQMCVDNWLTNHSGVCPYCNRLVKDLIEESKLAQGAEASTAGPATSPAAGPSGGAGTGAAARDEQDLGLQPEVRSD